MRTMTTKELSAIGLTEARLDLLRRAYAQERYRVRLFGVQSITVHALSGAGYIHRVLRYSDDEIRTFREMQTAMIEKAKTMLNDGDWKEATRCLKEAWKYEEKINETETRLTDKALMLLREFAELES